MKQDLLTYSKHFSDEFGCDFYFKPEWYGPTRSHKDKWAKVAVSLAEAAGVNKVVAMSSGNQGLALAVEAHKRKVTCAVCVEESIRPTYLKLFKKYNAQVFICKDEDDKCKQFEKLAKEGYFPLGATYEQRVEGKEMPAIEGYKVTAQEIIDELGDAPDIIVFPTAYADHPEGVLRGFIEQHEAGRAHLVPKFLLMRANEHDGSEAPSITTNLTTPYIKDVLARSKGEFVYVNNQEMHAAHDQIKKIQGWDVELASAASLAGLKKLPNKDQLKNKRLVAVLTSLADKTGI